MGDYVKLDKYVTSYGKFGKCDGCERARMATALIRGKRFCEKCKNEKYPKKAVEFQDSDATFKCRAESCGSDNVSFYETMVGSCCDSAMVKTPIAPFELASERQFMNTIFEKIKEKSFAAGYIYSDSISKLYTARKELRTAEEALKKAKTNVATAEKKIESARIDQDNYRALREESKKRLLIITKAAFKEYDEPPPKKAKQDEVNEKHQCRVCLNPYDDEHPEAIIIPCAHKFCFNCISTLPEKKCPNCRAEFADNNVYRTH